MSVERPSRWFKHPQHGPLPALLLALTVATGVVDAVSILALGRVFIANMTGNVVFIGFALAGAPGFSLAAACSRWPGSSSARLCAVHSSHAGGRHEADCWPW